uniref:Uncharacterized protein n=1 Tax=Romanomermis culicivorax TaxID=13658 RepID=A0A915J6W6_ROMCU
MVLLQLSNFWYKKSIHVQIGADDANRNVRSVLIEHLIQLRDQRKRNQANIEEYVKVLLQVNEDERLAHQNLRAYEDSLAQEKAILHQAQQITDQRIQQNASHPSEKDDLLETTKKLLETLLKEKEQEKMKKREKRRSSSYSSIRNVDLQHQQPVVNPFNYMMMTAPPGYPAYTASTAYNLAPPQPASKKQLTKTYWTNPAPPPRPMTPVKLPPAPPAGTKLLDVRSMYVRCARDEKWSK